MVTLKKLNLAEPFNHLGPQDIIFCRNILIYFSNPRKMDTLKRLAALLRPRGHLFLGASEPIVYYSRDYEMLRHVSGLYYRVKDKPDTQQTSVEKNANHVSGRLSSHQAVHTAGRGRAWL